MRAPETILKDPLDHKIDIWSFAYLMYEFFTARELFDILLHHFIPQEENDDHTLQMIDLLGLPPPEIFAKWPRREKYFDDDLKRIRSDVTSSETPKCEPFKHPTLEVAFEKYKQGVMEAAEQAQVLGLLRKILQWDPNLRPSTSELLDDPWFQAID